MPKKESVSSASPSDQSDYDSENSGSQGLSTNQKPQVLREVNRANVLNYQSDSSDEDIEGQDSDEMIPTLKKSHFKNEPKAFDQTKNPWGVNKKSFYQSKGEADSDNSLSSSEAEEDQLKEAERLAKIRREKLARQLA